MTANHTTHVIFLFTTYFRGINPFIQISFKPKIYIFRPSFKHASGALSVLLGALPLLGLIGIHF